MTKKIFITATGTDIGKTYISGLIVKKMREIGYNCGYFKPVLSGCGIDSLVFKPIPGDCCHVVKTSGLRIEPMKCLSYCFEDAVSPHLASKRVGVNISIDKIKSDYGELSVNYEYMVIEGAGGITCPIIINDNDTYLMWNLIKDFNTNVIVVADGGLGTINSILTTVEYAQKRDICIKGIILNNFDKDNYMHIDNKLLVEKLTGLDVIATVSKDETDLNIANEILEGLFE